MARRALFVGIATLDLGYLVQRYPVEDSKNQAHDVFTAAGGPATNASAAFSFLNSGGGRLVTALGKHPLSDIIREDLSHVSVAISDLASAHDDAPPVSSITVSKENGSRTIVSLDAARLPSVDTSVASEVVAGADLVLVDGHLMNLSIEVARVARSSGVPVVFDGGRWKPGNDELLDFVDVAICSRAFRPPGLEDDDHAGTHAYLAAKGVAMVATTDGAAPIRYSTTTEQGEIDVPQRPIVDTLGAGDIFHGAFCYYFDKSQDNFVSALKSAAIVAAGACSHFGTREWMKRGRSSYPDRAPSSSA